MDLGGHAGAKELGSGVYSCSGSTRLRGGLPAPAKVRAGRRIAFLTLRSDGRSDVRYLNLK